jgi:electron transfer flavoprotein alpha subunit
MILVFSEEEESAFEILTKGREIADSLKSGLAVILIGKHASEDIFFSFGADKIYLIDPEFHPDLAVESISAIVEQNKPEILLIGASKQGKEIAPRIAQRFGAGCATDCIDLSIDQGYLIIKRLVLGGRFIATQKFVGKPQIATVMRGSFEKKADISGKGEIIKIQVNTDETRVHILETKKKAPQEVKIEEADIIVSIGRGFKKKEDLILIKEFAEVLGGTIGCSRSIAADLKWLPEAHWVGLSGRKVKPRLYIAIGISGQVQHIAGIREAKTIIAINSDPNAPIFKACDYGIVGDLYKVVPELIAILKKQEV